MKKNEYPMVELGTVLSLIRNGLSVKQSKDVDGLPITRIETISNGEIDSTRVGYAGVTATEHGQWMLKPGDILLSHINSEEHLGKVALYDGFPGQLIHGMNLLNLRADHSAILPRYLLRVLRSESFRRKIRRVANRSVNQASVSITALSGLEIPLPPLPEQRRIADILDKADAIRRKRREARKVATDMIPSLFREMFGDPSVNDKGWPIRPFGELATNQDGRRKPVKASDRAQVQGEYPYYGASGIIDYVDSYLFDETTLLIAEDGANLLARSTPIAFIATGKYWVNNHAHVVSENGDARLPFLECHLNLRNIRDFVTGSAQPKLNQAALNRIPIPYPPLSLQDAFCRRLHALSALNRSQDSAVDEAEGLFNSLVQRAFRGEL